MPDAPALSLLDALLDSWDRGNAILLNLLRAVPASALDVRAADGGPTVGQLFMHVHFVRLVFLVEDAPEFARELPAEEWADERDPARIDALLSDRAVAVRATGRRRVEGGRAMDRHYDHPILLLQHMLWHEGYHHGQIKLALKLAGHPLADDEVGPGTWGVWMRKRDSAVGSQPA